MRHSFSTLLSLSGLLTTCAFSDETKHWQHHGDFGITLTKGNSDTLRTSFGFKSKKQAELWTHSNHFDAVYGEDDGDKTQQNVSNSWKSSRLAHASSQWYLAASNDFLYDPLADIDYRIGTQLTPGYHILDSEQHQLRVEAGPGLIIEKRDGSSDIYPSFKLAQYYHWHISPNAHFFQSLEATGDLGDFSNTLVSFEAGIESALVGPWSIRLTSKSTFYGETGSEAEDHDHLLSLGLGYSFSPGGKKAANLSDFHKKKSYRENGWTTSALVGGSYSSGNSSSKSVALAFLAKHKNERRESAFAVATHYGETDGETSAESAEMDLHHQYSYFKPCFAGIRLDADYDAEAELDYRFALTPYIGRKFYESNDDFLSAEVGPSFVIERQDDNSDQFFAPYISFKGEKHFSERTSLTAEIDWRGEATEPDNYLLSSKVALNHSVSQTIKLKIGCSNVFDNTPADDRENNDFKLITGLEFSL